MPHCSLSFLSNPTIYMISSWSIRGHFYLLRIRMFSSDYLKLSFLKSWGLAAKPNRHFELFNTKWELYILRTVSFSHLLVFLCFFNNTFNFRSLKNDHIFKVRPECDLVTLYNFLSLAKKLLILWMWSSNGGWVVRAVALQSSNTAILPRPRLRSRLGQNIIVPILGDYMPWTVIKRYQSGC